VVLHSARFTDLDARTFHDLARLRVDVFVVEQACPYPELDGRDVEPGTLHLWIAGEDGLPVAYLRVLDDAGTTRIGRVVTRVDCRHGGLAALLMAEALRLTTGPVVLDAQAHLQGWYERFGFVITGGRFVEDDIAHVPMRLAR